MGATMSEFSIQRVGCKESCLIGSAAQAAFNQRLAEIREAYAPVEDQKADDLGLRLSDKDIAEVTRMSEERTVRLEALTLQGLAKECDGVRCKLGDFVAPNSQDQDR
jgi:hypothetical protein